MKLEIRFETESPRKDRKKIGGKFPDHPLSELEFSKKFNAGGMIVTVSVELVGSPEDDEEQGAEREGKEAAKGGNQEQGSQPGFEPAQNVIQPSAHTTPESCPNCGVAVQAKESDSGEAYCPVCLSFYDAIVPVRYLVVDLVRNGRMFGQCNQHIAPILDAGYSPVGGPVEFSGSMHQAFIRSVVSHTVRSGYYNVRGGA